MNYRDFGTTGKKVSQQVFGGGAVGGLLINQDDETKLKAVRRAMGAGINWIDTAPSYGQGRSEEALGWILQKIDEKPYFATKFSIDLDDLNDIPGQIERSLEASLKRLRSEYVTLLQLHNQIDELRLALYAIIVIAQRLIKRMRKTPKKFYKCDIENLFEQA